ncbi:hypothetical protein C3L33_17748, partial [Rhododendron williamsianum]
MRRPGAVEDPLGDSDGEIAQVLHGFTSNDPAVPARAPEVAGQQVFSNRGSFVNANEMCGWWPEKKPAVIAPPPAQEAAGSAQQFKSLEDDHIEQMIEELLDYGPIEISPVVPSSQTM